MTDNTGDWIDPQVMDSHQQRKHRRIKAIAAVIEKRRRVNYKVFLAELEYQGIRKSVAEDYISALEDLGWIHCKNGDIVWDGTEVRTEKREVEGDQK